MRKEFSKSTAHPDSKLYQLMLGRKHYELINHIGNVLSTVTDQKKAVNDGNGNVDHWEALLVSYADYYPFGMQMDGRTGFKEGYRYNTQMKVDEVAGNGDHYTAQFWEYDPRLGRRWNINPIIYPWQS